MNKLNIKAVVVILTNCSKNLLRAFLYALRIAVKYPLIAEDIDIKGRAKQIR